MELRWSDLTGDEQEKLRTAWASGKLRERLSVAHRAEDARKDVLKYDLAMVASLSRCGDAADLSGVPREFVVQLLSDEQKALEYEIGSVEFPDAKQIEDRKVEVLSWRSEGKSRPFAYARTGLVEAALEIYDSRGGPIAQFSPAYPVGRDRPAEKTQGARFASDAVYVPAVARFLVSVIAQFESRLTLEKTVKVIAQAMRRIAPSRPDLFRARPEKGD